MLIDPLNYAKKIVIPLIFLLFHSGCAHTLMPKKSGEGAFARQESVSSAGSGLKANRSVSDQTDAIQRFNTGLEYVKNGKNQQDGFKKAAAEFAAAVSIKPDFEEARLNLGLAWLNLGEFEKALEQFEEVKKHGGKSNGGKSKRVKALYNIGVLYFRMGRLDDAAKSLESLLEDGNYEATIILGKIHYRQGRAEAAISDFEKAAEFSPRRPEAYLNMGKLYLSEKNSEEAATDNFLKVLKLQPDNSDACFNLGVLYYRSGDMDKSVKMFSRVTMLSSDAGAAYYNLGLIRYRGGDLKNAIMYLTLAKSYDYSPAIVALTQIHLDENRIDTALNLLNQFLAGNRNYPEAYCSLGAILQKTGRLEEAKAAYLKALRISPENIMALNNLAVIYRKTGEFDKALDTNYKILKIDPNFPYAHKNIGIIYDIFLNDYKVAKYHYGEYLRIGPDKKDDVRLWLNEMDKREKI